MPFFWEYDGDFDILPLCIHLKIKAGYIMIVYKEVVKCQMLNCR